MKNKGNFILSLLFLLGLFIFSYPIVSNGLAKRNHTRLIKEYQITANQLSEQLIRQHLLAAEEYNQALAGNTTLAPYLPASGYAIPPGYTTILNLNGIIGYIEIPVINIRLPIYHTISDEVLKKGVGHMEQTPFPIGGTGNHSVLTAHRGLPAAKLFTDLNKITIGDTFHIYILNQTITYTVDQILTIEPENTAPLEAAKNEDYITLITCTPYGINSHRLLVRGTRLPEAQTPPPEETQEQKTRPPYICLIPALLLAAALYWIHQKRKASTITP